MANGDTSAIQGNGAASKLGTPFNFDAESFLARRDLGEDIEFSPIQQTDLLEQAEEVVGGFLRGEIPGDVAEQIRINTAETAVQGGLSGQLGRNLTARDLGVTSLQLQEGGVQLASQLDELNTRRETVNRELGLKYDAFNESRRLSEQQFALELSKSNQSSAQIQLAALDLRSRNGTARLQLENELILNNSRQEIANVQQNIDAIAETFVGINRQLANISQFT